MKKAIFITVRTGSTRLPKKALLEINRITTIEHLIERVKKSQKKDGIVLCTTELPEDDILVELAEKHGIEYFRGSEKDKLERWRGAAEKFGVEFFVTADGDDLFCEPELIDLAFQQYERNKPDFIEEKRKLVCGAFSYAIKTEALEKVCQIKDTNDTEMMWVYFTDTGLFRCEELEGVDSIYKRPEIRATLDYPDDFKFFKTIIENLGSIKKDFNLRDVIEYLDKHPEVVKINQYLEEKFKNNQQKKTKLILKPGKYIGNELKYIRKVLNSEHRSATSGGWNNLLEREFAKKFHIKYAVALNSGTSALHACLSAAGVGPGDEVLVPPLPVIMDCFAAIYLNAVPVFVDIDSETFNIDPKNIEQKITPKTKAIITVSTYGLSPDMDPIMKLAKKHNLVVIEDNCQNFLGLYKGRLAGTIGDIAVYSFENSKHISTGEGGMAITNDERLAEKIRKCGGIGYKQLRAEEGRVKLNEGVFQDPDYKRFDSLGWNYRMTEFCAAIGLAQLERLEELVARRVKCAEYFLEACKGCDFLIPQAVPDDYVHSYWTFALKYEGEDRLGVSWKEFYNTYKEMGGDGFYGSCSVAYLEPVIYEGRYYGKGSHYTGPRFHYEKGHCPVAENLQPKIMQFKTNYRDLKLAEKKAEALKKTVEIIGK